MTYLTLAIPTRFLTLPLFSSCPGNFGLSGQVHLHTYLCFILSTILSSRSVLSFSTFAGDRQMHSGYQSAHLYGLMFASISAGRVFLNY